MTTDPSTPRLSWLKLAVPAILLALAGCTGKQLQELSDRAGAKWLNKPVTEAMTELGAPQRQRPIADLREYTWTTGVRNERGGDCTLALIADRRGTVVDYRMDGTPLGCNRLVAKA
ncbi:MAG TPA: hypothetical protein VJM14_21385 [Burkholderiales bacterium]|nr:hypothetical protein [Burkholderiales bacterium]